MHFVLSSPSVCVCKAQLWGQFFGVKDVIDKPNLGKILKFKLRCKIFQNICTFPNYLYCVRKHLCALFINLDLQHFFIFTNVKSKWIDLLKTLLKFKKPHKKYKRYKIWRRNIFEVDIRKDLVTCAHNITIIKWSVFVNYYLQQIHCLDKWKIFLYNKIPRQRKWICSWILVNKRCTKIWDQ
jgi:hypothetical protein